MAKGYGVFMTVFPGWKKWIRSVIPHIRGEKILEVSFGNGYLMTQYATDRFEIHGIDYNRQMLRMAEKKTRKLNFDIRLVQGNVEKLPYADASFDTVINTMAFTAYPDGDKALSEMKRVLKPGGRLLLVDFDFPGNRNLFGYLIVKFWEWCGDVMKDIHFLLLKYDFDFRDKALGLFGSVHLFVATRK